MIKRGSKDVQDGVHIFQVVKLSSADNVTNASSYSSLMIAACARIAMKPVCDAPEYCEKDTRALYLGQSGSLSTLSADAVLPSSMPAKWARLCSYTGSAKGNAALCNNGRLGGKVKGNLKLGEISYIYNDTAKTWLEARKHCLDMGGDLPSIHSKDDQVTILDASGYEDIWIGFNDAAKEGAWVWSDGRPRSREFENWDTSVRPSEPNNGGFGGNEDYSELKGKTSEGNREEATWADIGDADKRTYVCAVPNLKWQSPSYNPVRIYPSIM